MPDTFSVSFTQKMIKIKNKHLSTFEKIFYKKVFFFFKCRLRRLKNYFLCRFADIFSFSYLYVILSVYIFVCLFLFASVLGLSVLIFLSITLLLWTVCPCCIMKYSSRLIIILPYLKSRETFGYNFVGHYACLGLVSKLVNVRFSSRANSISDLSGIRRQINQPDRRPNINEH